jgi:hypothetical protein
VTPYKHCRLHSCLNISGPPSFQLQFSSSVWLLIFPLGAKDLVFALLEISVGRLFHKLPTAFGDGTGFGAFANRLVAQGIIASTLKTQVIRFLQGGGFVAMFSALLLFSIDPFTLIASLLVGVLYPMYVLPSHHHAKGRHCRSRVLDWFWTHQTALLVAAIPPFRKPHRNLSLRLPPDHLCIWKNNFRCI